MYNEGIEKVVNGVLEKALPNIDQSDHALARGVATLVTNLLQNINDIAQCAVDTNKREQS